MTKLTEINWDLLKFEYEINGSSLEELQEYYNISSAVMAYQAKDWKAIPAAKQSALKFPDLEDLTSLTDQVVSQVRQESETRNTIKQKFLLPKYIQLEHILVTKCIKIASSLEEDRASSSAVKTIAEVLKSLLSLNPILAPGEQIDTQSGDGAKEWKITFVDAKSTSPSEAEAVPGEAETV